MIKKIEGSLPVYLQEIQQYDLLTPEKEKVLGNKARLGDKDARKKLVEANLRFVVSVAKAYRNMGTPFSDLINEGNVGLIKAAERFDERRGVRFLSYAVWWIKQSIMKAVTEHIKSYRLPMSRAGKMLKVKRTREKVTREIGREPTVEEIAEELGMEPAKIEDAIKIAKLDISLDDTIKNTDDLEYLDVISEDVVTPEEEYYRNKFINSIRESLDELKARDRRIIIFYFGMEGKRPHTLEEIGTMLGISRERVRQLRNRALRQLRKHTCVEEEELIP
ncbi:RNA polymerase sigma factor RpoD/SigA [candidate division WOR-3 bacterium]|nr:RNA polymerase sigma factor RpoD/SigA [candidate division WOR-3 bacterium]MCK4528284.1 RNA polymerase sigma factor RpoD/SigA [candidate division WOR-3 bacterium]